MNPERPARPLRAVFADTFYWIAIFNPNDSFYGKATTLSQSLQNTLIITTDEVLTEFLTYFASADPAVRCKAVNAVRGILRNPKVHVIPQTRQSFLAGLDLYEARPDKSYSLPDCISMNVMKAEGLTDILTHDEHFRQEGFRTLFT